MGKEVKVKKKIRVELTYLLAVLILPIETLYVMIRRRTGPLWRWLQRKYYKD